MNYKIINILIILFLPAYCYAYSQAGVTDFKYGEISPVSHLSDKINKTKYYPETTDKIDQKTGPSDNMQSSEYSLHNSSFPNLSTIEEINRDKINYGTYYIRGYVSKIYTCLPCEEGTVCKKCMQDNIIVSSKKEFLAGYRHLTDENLIVFVDDIEQFEIGKKYLMLIKILDVKTTNQVVNNIKMIYHKEIKGE